MLRSLPDSIKTISPAQSLRTAGRPLRLHCGRSLLHSGTSSNQLVDSARYLHRGETCDFNGRSRGRRQKTPWSDQSLDELDNENDTTQTHKALSSSFLQRAPSGRRPFRFLRSTAPKKSSRRIWKPRAYHKPRDFKFLAPRRSTCRGARTAAKLCSMLHPPICDKACRIPARRRATWRLVAFAIPIGLCTCGTKPVTDFARLKTDDTGYELEQLPFVFVASYAQGDNIFLGLEDGYIFRASESDLTAPFESLGRAFEKGPRMVFVSRDGDVFVSADGQATYRRAEDGEWQAVLDMCVWRMDQDDQGSLYAGNYTKDNVHVATLYKSTDRGDTWTPVFIRADNQHIHTVRWSGRARRLYIAWGDAATRGQAYSDDRGDTWHILDSAPDQGHTDVCFTDDYVIWCSDDQSGRIYRVRNSDGQRETTTGSVEFVWWGIADGKQVYAATMTSLKNGGDRAVVLASRDQAGTWQKLMETTTSTEPYSRGFIGESREVSAGGWVYFTKSDADGLTSYRMRVAQP